LLFGLGFGLGLHAIMQLPEASEDHQLLEASEDRQLLEVAHPPAAIRHPSRDQVPLAQQVQLQE